MRIAFIGQKGIPAITGGVEKHVEEVATRMAKMGHQVFVYVRNNYTDRKLRKYKGVQLIHLPSIPTKNLDAISHTFFAIIHALFCRYDVIHFQAIGPTSLAGIIKTLSRRTALIATFHCQDYFHQKWGKLAQAYLRFGEKIASTVPDKTIVVSKILKEYVRITYAREAVLIPNGADVQLNPKTNALDRWELKDKKYILSVGRLIRHKGVHYLIEAFKHLQNTAKLTNNFKLVIVGEGFYTDDYVKELKKLAAGREDIVFTGNQNNGSLEQLFSHAYLFVQPSESEGLSLALLEAMGYGLAPLVSNIPENLEAVGKKGFSFKSKDVASLEKKLAYLINKPSEVAKAGKLAKEIVERDFSWDSIARKTLLVYEEVLAAKKEIHAYAWKSRKA